MKRFSCGARVCFWPQAAVEECLLFRRYLGISRHPVCGVKMTLITQSGPDVARASVIGVLD